MTKLIDKSSSWDGDTAFAAAIEEIVEIEYDNVQPGTRINFDQKLPSVGAYRRLDAVAGRTRLSRRLAPKLLVVTTFLVSAVALTGGDAEASPGLPQCNGTDELWNGLCYPECAVGYDGDGPVCWGDCPVDYRDDGAVCTIDAHIIAKTSYGRGGGTAPTRCAPGQENQAGLCYNQCAPGYYGVGPVCWQSCASGYADHGATCYQHLFSWYWKDSYGRGAGTLPNTCSAGQQRDGGLCYPTCASGYDGVGPVCWQGCPSGYADDGALCRKDVKIVARPSYGRSEGHAPTCRAESFTSSDPVDVMQTEPFTMVIASDPQLPWWRGSADPDCTTEECILDKGIVSNRDHVRAINSVTQATWSYGVSSFQGWPQNGAPISQPAGVIVNGDLTAYWHEWQVELFRSIYDIGYRDAEPDVLSLPLFPGLGNHDYANNVGGCQGADLVDLAYHGDDACAARAVRWIKGAIACDTLAAFDADGLESFDVDSLAYSWNEGRYHFVQLHNYPTYEVDHADTHFVIKRSIDWLRADLQRATDRGQYSVINLHDWFDKFKPANSPEFLAALEGQRIAVVFAGHSHFARDMGNVPGTTIPVFEAGSAEHSSFLLTEFGPDYFRVAVMDSSTGHARFVDPTNVYTGWLQL